jgi:hypothetical protein
MVLESKSSYEECRRQRLEENKKRLEELSIEFGEARSSSQGLEPYEH